MYCSGKRSQPKSTTQSLLHLLTMMFEEVFYFFFYTPPFELSDSKCEEFKAVFQIIINLFPQQNFFQHVVCSLKFAASVFPFIILTWRGK